MLNDLPWKTIPRVRGKFYLGEQNEAGQSLNSSKRMHWSQQIPFFNYTRDDFTRGHYRVVNTEIKLITFLVAEGREAVYSQRKQDLELTVAQIISFS